MRRLTLSGRGGLGLSSPTGQFARLDHAAQPALRTACNSKVTACTGGLDPIWNGIKHQPPTYRLPPTSARNSSSTLSPPLLLLLLLVSPWGPCRKPRRSIQDHRTAPKLPTGCQTFRLGVVCPYAYLPGTHYAGEETALYSGVRRGPHSHTIEGPPHPLLPFSRPLFALKSARPPASARVSDSLAQGNGPGSPTSLPCAARYLWRLLLLPGAWLASLDVDTKGIRSCFGTSAPPHSDSLKPLILNTHTHTHLLPPLPPTLRRQPYSSLSLSLKT